MLESCARAEKAAGVHKRSGGWRARTRTMLRGHVRLIESRACSDLSLLKSAKGKSIVAARSVAAGLLVESQDRHRAEKLRLAVTVWIKAGNADAVQSRSLAGKDGLLLGQRRCVRTCAPLRDAFLARKRGGGSFDSRVAGAAVPSRVGIMWRHFVW